MSDWEEFISKRFSTRNLSPKGGGRMYLQDPTGGQVLRPGPPFTCVAGMRVYPLTCGFPTSLPPGHPGLNPQLWPSAQLPLEHPSGLGWVCWRLDPPPKGGIQKRGPCRHWKPLRAQRAGRMKNLLQRGTGMTPDSLPHGEGHGCRRVTVGGRGPHCLGLRADLMKLWWKHNWKSEEGDFPAGPAVKTPHFHCKGCRVKP